MCRQEWHDERVEPDEDDVDQHEQRAQAHVAPLVLGGAEGQDHVVGQDQGDHDRGVPEPAVDVLGDQREAASRRCTCVRLGDGAGRRREPERPVVGLAVVVAGQPEAEREDQDDQRRRERAPLERLPEVRGALDAVAAGTASRTARGTARSSSRGPEGPPGRVDDEGGEHHERRQRGEPPAVGAQGASLDPGPRGPVTPVSVSCQHVATPPQWTTGPTMAGDTRKWKGARRHGPGR